MHGSMRRREETRPVGPARAARSRRLSPTLQEVRGLPTSFHTRWTDEWAPVGTRRDEVFAERSGTGLAKPGTALVPRVAALTGVTGLREL
jgi:hypothetical protein